MKLHAALAQAMAFKTPIRDGRGRRALRESLERKASPVYMLRGNRYRHGDHGQVAGRAGDSGDYSTASTRTSGAGLFAGRRASVDACRTCLTVAQEHEAAGPLALSAAAASKSRAQGIEVIAVLRSLA